MRQLLLLTLISLTPAFMVAKRKKYHAITNNDKITCSLSLLDEKEVDDFFGSFGSPGFRGTVWDNVTETIRDGEGSTEYSLNPSFNGYMILRVKIQNNTNQGIYIPPEEYLDGIQDALLSKYYISLFYKEETSPLLKDILFGAGFLGSASFLALALYTVLYIPSFFSSRNTLDAEDFTTKIVGFAMLSLLAGLGVFAIPRAYRNALKLRKKYKEVLEITKRYKLNKDGDQSLVHTYSIANFLYKLSPGHILEDLIFVKRHAINEDFLDTEQIALIYSFNEEPTPDEISNHNRSRKHRPNKVLGEKRR